MVTAHNTYESHISKFSYIHEYIRSRVNENYQSFVRFDVLVSVYQSVHFSFQWSNEGHGDKRAHAGLQIGF